MEVTNHFKDRLEDRIDDWYGDINDLLNNSIFFFNSFRDKTISYRIYQGYNNDYVIVTNGKVAITTYKINKRAQVFKLFVKDRLYKFNNRYLNYMLRKPDDLYLHLLKSYKQKIKDSGLYWSIKNKYNFKKVFDTQLNIFLRENKIC